MFSVFTYNGDNKEFKNHQFKTKGEAQCFINGIEFAGEKSDISHSKILTKNNYKKEFEFMVNLELVSESSIKFEVNNKSDLEEEGYQSLTEYLESACDFTFDLTKKDFNLLESYLERVVYREN